MNKTEKCDWDIIRNICQKALKNKGLTKEQIRKTSAKLLLEVRNK